MTTQRVGVLLKEAVAEQENDGGRRIRRLLRAVVRQELGGMLRVASTNGPEANSIAYRKMPKGYYGVHASPTGSITLRTGARRSLGRIATRLANGRELSTNMRETLHALVHESIHGFGVGRDAMLKHRSTIHRTDYTAVNETFTETAARLVMRRRFGQPADMPDPRTGDDPVGFYSSLLLRMMTVVRDVADDHGLLEGRTPSQRSAEIPGIFDRAASGVLAREWPDTAPQTPHGTNVFLWAWVAELPLRGDARTVEAARLSIYRRLIEPTQYKGMV
jgi:hypothetical protein